jgi:hypothetical protein
MMWSVLYPRLTPTEVGELQKALTKIDLVGQLIGSTKISAAPLILQNLGEIAQAIYVPLERTERRLFEARRKRGKLTAADLEKIKAMTEQASQGGEPSEEV